MRPIGKVAPLVRVFLLEVAALVVFWIAFWLGDSFGSGALIVGFVGLLLKILTRL